VVQTGFFALFWFVPDHSVLRDIRFQHVLVCLSLAYLAFATISFGAIVGTVDGGGTAFQAAIVGVAALLPPALLGLWGGKIAAALPKRLAIGGAYVIIGVICVAIPLVFGTDFAWMVLLVLAVYTVNQVAGPAERAVLPLVSTEEQFAAGVSIVNFGMSAGTGLGIALVAPALLTFFDQSVVFIVAGVVLLVAATRAFEVPPEKEWGAVDWSLRGAGPKTAMDWLMDHFAVCTMVLLGVLAGTSNRVMQDLAPAYVRDGLDIAPAKNAYVFAPATLGMIVAMAAGPRLTRVLGARGSAVLGFLSVALGLVLLGLVHWLTPPISPWNPFQLVRALGATVSNEVLAAALLTIPIGFGTTVTALAVQLYVNSNVEEDKQAAAFSIQYTLTNWFGIVPLLLLGGVATAIGPEPVMFIIPALMVVSAGALLWAGLRYRGRDETPKGMRLLEAFLREPASESRLEADRT